MHCGQPWSRLFRSLCPRLNMAGTVQWMIDPHQEKRNVLNTFPLLARVDLLVVDLKLGAGIEIADHRLAGVP